MSGGQRLWFVKRGHHVRGPFPEPLLARYVVLGRVTDADRISLDHHHWHVPGEVAELTAAIRLLLEIDEHETADTDWRDDRFKARLRWLDDRKSPDPRAQQSHPDAAHWKERRTHGERRRMPETVEQQAYRERRAEFERWLRTQRQRYARPLLALLAVGVLVAGMVVFYQPVNPIKVGLTIHRGQCELPPGRGVNWNGCDKRGYLLVGADLRGAHLAGASLVGANLRYADLRDTDLSNTDLTDADLTGARLGQATWIDGRGCAPDSVGVCRPQ